MMNEVALNLTVYDIGKSPVPAEWIAPSIIISQLPRANNGLGMLFQGLSLADWGSLLACRVGGKVA